MIRENEANDCAVIAVSLSTGIPYDEAHALLKAAGRKNRKGISPILYMSAIRQLGFTVTPIKLQSKTVRTIERELAKYWGGVKILVGIRRHVLTWDGNEIADWTAGRNHRIRDVYVIHKGDVPVGRSVPVPERKAMLKTSRPRSPVAIRIGPGGEFTEHSSVAAAYKATGLNLSGHQRIRRAVKAHGEWTFWAYRDNSYSSELVTIRLIKE